MDTFNPVAHWTKKQNTYRVHPMISITSMNEDRTGMLGYFVDVDSYHSEGVQNVAKKFIYSGNGTSNCNFIENNSW